MARSSLKNIALESTGFYFDSPLFSSFSKLRKVRTNNETFYIFRMYFWSGFVTFQISSGRPLPSSSHRFCSDWREIKLHETSQLVS